MNERMAELFGQAGISDSINEEFEIEYLAELIVKECADVAFLEANSRKTQRAVLQHFGVEE